MIFEKVVCECNSETVEKLNAAAQKADLPVELLASHVAPTTPPRNHWRTASIALSVALLAMASTMWLQPPPPSTMAEAGPPPVAPEILERLSSTVNVRLGEMGQTELTRAAHRGDIATVRALLEVGADPNMASFAVSSRDKILPDEIGRTPLMWALRFGHLEVANALLDDPRTNPAITNYHGSTALTIFIRLESRPHADWSVADLDKLQKLATRLK